MTTITKEWLQQTIAEFENTRDDIPFGLDDDDAKILIVLKRALASLERERIRREHAEWSDKTFGDVGPVGPLKHLSKEALEAAADPSDPLEWADMQFLLWDAQRRMGISDEFITRAMIEKLEINKSRQWPEPKDGEPRLHIKEQLAPVVPPAIEPDYEVIKSILPTANPDEYACCIAADIWNACRAAMLQGAEPVSNHDELALYYLQGQKDGLEWAAQLAEANHPLTGDWLYDDPLELAKAIRKGPDMPGFAGSSPVTQDGWISCSERMPIIGELNWRTSFPLLITCEIGVIPAYYGFVSVNGDKHYGFMESLKYGDDRGDHPQTNEYGLISNVTHWMPLPEPPI
ncbi:DUF550 domain-containing protein [Salmonella enterica subsp. enterica serovar Johannesburg]|uniref:DUF550 domain-containing protein n=6 Tax=Enterobacteriaceae TaxID=543 RepID=A0A5T3C7V2_SALER|nr:dATP/dGTP pyrophosphohydrolase domain-containing protein [Salmonella enterica]EAA7333846.1 DUF550 domain-containing protein [Salmonella enterica subsp. enterica]EBQ9676610.1 DUF550 domain-containing protein [Salmonella enterica subsp. enterica serovar Urbana]ECH7857410.1 DUF550 domain-containing protein [Salmonella enterica subsp. enterica serovar Brandenburg]ECH8770359.1 DUF550 domain-containing protein [Salmonella enterica subsp. enterica serovar Hvittingfoss]EDI1787328.1 DUF550 domain-co